MPRFLGVVLTPCVYPKLSTLTLSSQVQDVNFFGPFHLHLVLTCQVYVSNYCAFLLMQLIKSVYLDTLRLMFFCICCAVDAVT